MINLLESLELAVITNKQLPTFEYLSINRDSSVLTNLNFEKVNILPETGKSSESSKNEKGTDVVSKTIEFELFGIALNNMRLISKYKGQILAARIKQISGVELFVYPLRLEYDSTLTGNIKKRPVTKIKLTGSSLYKSPVVL